MLFRSSFPVGVKSDKKLLKLYSDPSKGIINLGTSLSLTIFGKKAASVKLENEDLIISDSTNFKNHSSLNSEREFFVPINSSGKQIYD